MPEVLEKEVLARLDATDHAMIAQVARPWRAAVGPGRILPATLQKDAVKLNKILLVRGFKNAWR